MAGQHGFQDEVLEHVLDKIRHHIHSTHSIDSTTKPTHTHTSIARHILQFLDNEYNLSSNINIPLFVSPNASTPTTPTSSPSSEMSKARSHLAIATQRAAAFFALRANLLQSTFEELEKHIEATKKIKPVTSQSPEDFAKEFVQPLERQAAKLKTLQQHADQQRQTAQARFQDLRQQATRQIMEQLQRSRKEYQTLFKQIDTTELCAQAQRLHTAMRETRNNETIQQRLNSAQTPHNTHNTHSIEFLQALYGEAQGAKTILHAIIAQVQSACSERGMRVEVELGSLKAVEQAVEKSLSKYDGDFSRLLDLVRATVLCKDGPTTAAVVAALADMAHNTTNTKFQIIRVKNRLDPSFNALVESGGYRDVLVNVRLETGHVCEVQIQLEGFHEVQTSGGQKMFSVARSLHLLDSELSHVRLECNEYAKASDIREEVRAGLQRVEGGTCQTLNLSHLQMTLAECAALRNALQSSACNVREVLLAGCGVERERSTAFSDTMPEGGCLGAFSVVDLASNQGITDSCLALFVSDALRRLSFRDCRLGAGRCLALASALTLRMPTQMREINLGNTDIGPEGAQHLTGAIACMPSLTHLDLQYNNLGPEGARQLASGLAKLLMLTHLDLQSNRLGFQGTQHVAGAISSMQQLTSLNVSLNNLGPNGAQYLATALTHVTKLSSLNLQGNDLSAQGAQHLAAALANKQHVTFLDLSWNNLGTQGAHHLVAAWSNMPLMTSLNLEHNELGPDGAQHLSGGLVNMHNIALLNLSDNDLGPKGVQRIANVVAGASKLTTLNLANNKLNFVSKMSVRKSLEGIASVEL